MVTDGAASLSLVITGTVLSDRAVYLESLVLLLLIAKITSLSIVPSRIGSSIPDTVTVWAWFQLDALNVNEDFETLASVLSLAVRSNTTLLVGSEPRTTVNVSWLPPPDWFIKLNDQFSQPYPLPLVRDIHCEGTYPLGPQSLGKPTPGSLKLQNDHWFLSAMASSRLLNSLKSLLKLFW